MSDTELLDILQKLNDEAEFTGLCILRKSTIGRGWRLHETTGEEFGVPQKSVRQAIEDFASIKDTPHD